MMARIRFAEPGNSAVLELYPSDTPKAYDSNVFTVANQRHLTYHNSIGYKRSVIPYFSTGVIGEASKCFFFLCGYSDDAEYPSALLLESTPEEIAEYPLIEWLQHSLTILDFAISPDGQSAVMHARYQRFEYLLHLRLDDLRLTTLLMTTERELPPSAYGNAGSNNHFIWAECGTILMTAGGKAFAFRLD